MFLPWLLEIYAFKGLDMLLYISEVKDEDH